MVRGEISNSLEQTKEEFEQSKKDISDKWLDRVNISLEGLEYYERQLRTGFQDIFEYIQMLGQKNPLVKASLSQIQATEFMINEFDMIFNNVRKVVDENELKEMRKKLELCREVSRGEKGETYNFQYAQYARGKNYVSAINFTKTFDILIKILTELRRDLVSSLSHILWVGREKPEEGAEG